MRPIDADALVAKYGDYYVEAGPEDGFIGTLKCLVDMQPTVGGWISVKERMPDLEEQVLIVYEWTGRSGAKYRETALNSFMAMRFMGYKPLFWMPMPELPEGVKADA